MAREANQRADSFETENTGGLLTGFLAEEDDFDRRALWRLGSWGAASVGAVILALVANQSSIGWRRSQVATSDLARQQIQAVARESQNEARRLASAIDTLNGDRDRLYSRVTVLEQGLDSVTGSIARQNSAAASPQAIAPPSTATDPPPVPQNPAPAPVTSPVATTAPAAVEKPVAVVTAAEPTPAPATPGSPIAGTPTTPLMASKSLMAPPDSAAAKLVEPGSPGNGITTAPIPDVVGSVSLGEDGTPDAFQAAAGKPVPRTEFGVDVGGANSLGGLRALWRGLLKAKSNAPLTSLRPIIVVKESSNGLGMQLRLVAGPLHDAAAAAKICAALTESQRSCETTVFDGQRLAMKADEAPPPAAVKPAPTRRRHSAKRAAAVEQPAKKPESSTLSALFSRR